MWSILFYVPRHFRFIASQRGAEWLHGKALANKMHKAEIGKSMPLLITLRCLSHGLPGRAARWSRRQRHHTGVCRGGQVLADPGACALCPCPPGAGARALIPSSSCRAGDRGLGERGHSRFLNKSLDHSDPQFPHL